MPDKEKDTSRALLNATADSAVLIDKNGVVLDANDNIATSLGTTRDALIGSVIHSHHTPDVAEKRKAKELEAAREKKLVRFVDFRNERWMENSIYPVFDSDGNLSQYAIFSRDITYIKKAETALRESEHYYKTLFESATDAILIMEGLYCIDCNQQTLDMFSCTR
jgi:two-component system response regulator HydG